MSDAPETRVVRKIRTRAVVFLGTAIVAGIAAIFLVKVYLDQARHRSSAAPVATTPVVVATGDLASGAQLEPAQLAIVQWPSSHVPAGTFQKISDVLGQTPKQAMVKGEPVLRGRLANKSEGQGLAAILETGARAMAVKVDQVVGIAGFVQPNDRVDVIATMTTDDEARAALGGKASKISRIILQDIRVLAVGEHLATDGAKPVKVQVVTLEVMPDESERLALASQHGKVQLTMRSRIDHETVETDGVTPLALLAPDGEAPVPPPKAGEPPPPPKVRRTYRARPDKPPVAQVEAPVVEILRGTQKVEQRKLQPGGGRP